MCRANDICRREFGRSVSFYLCYPLHPVPRNARRDTREVFVDVIFIGRITVGRVAPSEDVAFYRLHITKSLISLLPPIAVQARGDSFRPIDPASMAVLKLGFGKEVDYLDYFVHRLSLLCRVPYTSG